MMCRASHNRKMCLYSSLKKFTQSSLLFHNAHFFFCHFYITPHVTLHILESSVLENTVILHMIANSISTSIGQQRIYFTFNKKETIDQTGFILIVLQSN